MAVFRVAKNQNYTVLSNYHLKDRRLSWKAKGILSNMLSLPESWDFSLAGLATLSSDGESSTRSALKELEEYGYLIRKPIREAGKFADWEYLIFEKPHVEKPVVENPQVDNPVVENRTQLNTKEFSTKELSTKELNKESTADKPPKPTRKKYGEYGWVLLTDEQYNKLLADLGEEELKRCITYIDESAQGNGNKNRWKDWNLVIRRCSREGWGLGNKKISQRNQPPRTQDIDYGDGNPLNFFQGLE